MQIDKRDSYISGSEAGAALTEYALALVLLVVGLVAINATMVDSAKEKGLKIAEGSTKMLSCTAGDATDMLATAIGNTYDDDLCQ